MLRFAPFAGVAARLQLVKGWAFVLLSTALTFDAALHVGQCIDQAWAEVGEAVG